MVGAKMGGAHVITNVHNLVRMFPLQVVTGSSLGEVARTVITHVRFPLLNPDKLSEVEKENKKNNHIPVSTMCPTDLAVQ